MINNVEINGFKSLREFSLNLTPGLNILVGPNGSGKTNIIQFFEFLANFIRDDLPTAIGKAGGISSIFTRFGEDKYAEKLSAKIIGEAEQNEGSLSYDYFFEITFDAKSEAVFCSKQEFKIRSIKSTTQNNSDPQSWDILIIQEFDKHQQRELTVKFGEGELLEGILRLFGPPLDKKNDDPSRILERTKDLFNRFLSNNANSSTSILENLGGLVSEVGWVIFDLINGEIFNIVPSRVRQVEDSTRPPGIQKDGSGLAATLYAMESGRALSRRELEEYEPSYLAYGEEEYVRSENPYTISTLKKIKDFLKLTNSSIADVKVVNTTFDNQLSVRFTIGTGKYTTVLPLKSMSDGTVKWLTLITAVLTSKALFSIEEPENYLHPLMQGEIVRIMRNTLFAKPKKSFILMSTHSVSLLDCSSPEEIIVVSMTEGKSIARRVHNIEEMKKHISDSGFGLGYFYNSGALDE